MATYSPFSVGQILPAALMNALSTGWVNIDGAGTFAYSSADSPTFVLATPADLTGLVGVGMRLKLTQTTVGYFIVTAITSSTITLYGGTDYTLANAAVSLVSFSPHKAPLGFPTSVSKWSVIVTDSSSRTHAGPGSGTWYNPGSVSIDVPIGSWELGYEACLKVANDATLAVVSAYGTLSTATGSESDTQFTSYIQSVGNATIADGSHYLACETTRSHPVTLTVKTTYYMDTKTDDVGDSAVGFSNNSANLRIKAVCAYL